MRILKVVQSYYPFQEMGGTAFKVRALARTLAERGHSVTVLTADLGLKARLSANFDVQKGKWGWELREGNVTAIYLPVAGRYRALTWNPAVGPFSRASLHEFDVIHFYGLYDLLGPIVSHYARAKHIPYFLEPMGMYRPIDRGFFLKRAWHATAGRKFVRNTAKIVATSEMEQEDLVQDHVPADKIVVRYNGINLPPSLGSSSRGTFRAKWNLPQTAPLILFLGRLVPRKGAEMLIDAFATACPEKGVLVIAGPEGESGYLAKLKEQAANSAAANRIILTGPLYDEDKNAALADADLFVLPSRYENFANAPLEAIAHGVPVIISDACGIRSLVKDRAGLVISLEQSALVSALRALLEDGALYSRLKSGCPSIVAKLDWGKLAGQMESHYLAEIPQP